MAFVGWEGECEVAGVEFPPDNSPQMAVHCFEFVPRDWVWNSPIRVAQNIIQCNNTCGCCKWHEIGDVAVHIVVDMVIVSWCTATTIGIHHALIYVVRDCHRKRSTFAIGCWWCKLKRWEILLCFFENSLGLVKPVVLRQLLSCSSYRLPIGRTCVVAKGKSSIHDQSVV